MEPMGHDENNIYIMGILEGEEKDKRVIKYKVIMAEDFPNLGRGYTSRSKKPNGPKIGGT